jgi:hypothetical protein
MTNNLKPERVALIADAFQIAGFELSPLDCDATAWSDEEYRAALVAAVRRLVPDATDDEISAGERYVADEIARTAALSGEIYDAIGRIVERMSPHPEPTEQIGSILARAAADGDAEAEATLPKLRDAAIRPYIRARGH